MKKILSSARGTRRSEEAKGREKGFLMSFVTSNPRFRHREDDSGDPVVEGLAVRVIGAAIEVHRHLGPGLPEAVYETALSFELRDLEIAHQRQAPVPVVYKGREVGEGFIDILVERRLVIELKAVDELHPKHHAQVRAYLCASDLNLGLLINFNNHILRDGIRRIVRRRS
jgi:GxxExxY protein